MHKNIGSACENLQNSDEKNIKYVNKSRGSLCSLAERLKVVKMSILPK